MKTLKTYKQLFEANKLNWKDYDIWEEMSDIEKKEAFYSLEPNEDTEFGEIVRELKKIISIGDEKPTFYFDETENDLRYDEIDIQIKIVEWDENYYKIILYNNSYGVYRSEEPHGTRYYIITPLDMGDAEDDFLFTYVNQDVNKLKKIDELFKSHKDVINLRIETDGEGSLGTIDELLLYIKKQKVRDFNL